MKIALVHPYPWPEVRRGAERYVEDLCKFLAAVGHEVIVVTGTGGEPSEQRRADGALAVRRHRRRVRGAHRLGMGEVETFGLDALAPLRRLRPDVVHAMVPSAALAGRAARRPTIYTVLGHPTADQLPERPVPRRLFTSAVRRATAVAVLSHASALALAGSVGRRAIVLPPGIRSDQFPLDPSPRTGPPRVLFSASLDDPRKHARLAVEAFALFHTRHPDARLVLSGQGHAAPALAGMAEAARDAVDVAGPGRPDEVPQRYRQATVTLLPAEHEAFGLVLVESLSSGTPVVCTPAGGMPEIVEADVGRVARSWAASDLATALEEAAELAAHPATPARCAARVRRFDWDEQVGPDHLAVYERLVARRPL